MNRPPKFLGCFALAVIAGLLWHFLPHILAVLVRERDEAGGGS